MAFVADDLAAWLVGLLADAGRRWLITWVLGRDEERELRSAATAAVQRTATELRPEGGERAEELAMVVSQVFSAPVLDVAFTGHGMLLQELQELQARIARQLSQLDDPGLTGTGKSSAGVLGVSAATLADTLFSHLVREIVIRGARGGPLTPLAAQLNNDVTHLQGQRLGDMVGRLAEEVREALGRLDVGQAAATVQEYEFLLPELLIERDWLMAEVDAFCRAHRRGYVLIEADAGIGKTTFAAWLAWRKQCAVHFAQLDPDAGTTAVAVRSLGAQLITKWDLADLASDLVLPKKASSAAWLRTVFQAAARRRDEVAPDTPIVVVVDALDAAVEQPPGHLPLGLPDELPAGVYVVATARSGGLRHAPPGSACRSLDGPQDENLTDLRRYLTLAANEENLAQAIADAGIAPGQFIELLLDRSLGVWVYVSHVLEEIRLNPQKVSKLPGLPHGLRDYYHNSFATLCDGPDGDLYVPLLASLAISAEPVDAPTLAAFAGIDDERWVERSLDHALRPYCSIRHVAGKARRFTVRHPSLSDYLTGKPSGGNTSTDGELADVSSLRVRLANACRDAHDRICDRYLTEWGGLEQHLPGLAAEPGLGGMDGGYALRWLTWHLLAAGRENDLHQLLTCGTGQNTWFAAHDGTGDVAGYLHDVGRARGAAQRLGMQVRYALVEASIASLSTALPPALIGELVTRGCWTASRALSLIKRMSHEQRQAQALAHIVERLPEELLGPALSVAIRYREEENRATTLQSLIPHPDLRGYLLERAADAVLSLENPDFFLPAMVATAAKLPDETLRQLPWRHPTRLWGARSVCLWAATALFCSDERSQGARTALALTRDVDDEHARGVLVAALLPHFPEDAFYEVLDVLGTIRPSDRDAALIALARRASAERLGDLLDFAVDPEPEFFRQAAARPLTAEQLPAALRRCQAMSGERDRAEAFAALTPRMDADQARRFLASAPLRGDFHDMLDRPEVVEFLDLYTEEPELLVVSALLDRLPKREACAAVTPPTRPGPVRAGPGGSPPGSAYRFSRSYRRRAAQAGHTDAPGPSAGPGGGRGRRPGEPMTDLSRRKLEHPLDAKAFAWFARYLPGDLRRRALTLIYEGMSWTEGTAEEYAPFLTRFAPFSDDEVAEAFTALGNASPVSWWPRSCLMMADLLAPHLTCDQLRYVRNRVMAFPLEEECFAALAELGRYQPHGTRDQTCKRGLDMANGVSHGKFKARAVAALAPIIAGPERADEAFEILWSVRPHWGVQAMEAMADVLPAARLAEVPGRFRDSRDAALDIPKILKRLSDNKEYTTIIDSLIPRPEGSWHPSQSRMISSLAPIMSPSQARRAWHVAEPEDFGYDDAEALSALVGRLPEHERAAAVDEVLAAYTPRFRWDEVEARVLGRLARAASTERLTRALREFLGRERAVKERVLEELAPGLPETLIEEALQYALSDDDDISCQALAKLAPRLSGALLNRAIAHVGEMEHEPWKAVALTPLARQLPRDREDREAVLAMAVEAAASWPSVSSLQGVMADLIPQLPQRLRPRAVSAAADQVCSDLRYHRQPRGEEFDRLHAVLGVLKGPELEQLYARLGKEVQVPRVRAHAQAAVIRRADEEHAAGFFADQRPLHYDWPRDLDRAGLMDLIAAAAWWINGNGGVAAADEVIEAIFDVARWWP